MAMVLGAITSLNRRAYGAKIEAYSERNDIPLNERLVVDNRPPAERQAAIERHAIMYALLEPENISPFGDGEPEQFVGQFEDVENDI